MDDILKYAVENGIIDLSYVREKIEMSKREEILKQHTYKISEGADGKWRTYLPDKERGRRMVKKSTREKLESAIIDFYKAQKEVPVTFSDAYYYWRRTQDELVSAGTTVKYDTDYKRYFKDTEFAEREIKSITVEDIKVFIVKTVKTKKLCKKACKTLFGYIKNTVTSARINKVISEDPMEFLEAKQFYKYCEDTVRPIDKTIVSDEDMEKLYDKFYEDYRKQPSYIPTYAVHLASLTGMRVGELSALTWECITDTVIIIDKSEKYDRTTHTYFIGKTKNGKERVFPITKEIRAVLNAVREAEEREGYICEWVFANMQGRIHAPIISSCIKNKCRQVGISDKGIHALRRTINSKMKCNGVSSTVAAALLGHTAQVNDQYYTFDVSSLEQKTSIVSGLTSQMPVKGNQR